MKVILQKNVPGLGDLGEIKEVANGYARNYLLPRKLVTSAHTGSHRALEHQKRILAMKAERRKSSMEKLAATLRELDDLEIEAAVGAKDKLYGSVTTKQICELLSIKGITLDRRKIEIGQKIQMLGNYTAKVSLMDGLQVLLSLKIIPDAASIKRAEEQAKKQKAEISTAEESEPEAKAEISTAEESKPEAKAKISTAEESKPEAKAEISTAEESKPEAKTEISTAEESKPEAKTEISTAEESKPEAKTEISTDKESKPEAKAKISTAEESKPEAKAKISTDKESEPEAKTEISTDKESKPEAKTEISTDKESKPEAKAKISTDKEK